MYNQSLPLPFTTWRIPAVLNAYVPPLLWAVVIFLLSSQSVLPSLDVSSYDFIFKKCAHMFVYGVLFLLLQRGALITIKPTTITRTPHLLWMVPLFFTIMYAMTDEIHQTFVPGRYGTLRDIGYDLTGAFLAFLKRYQYI